MPVVVSISDWYTPQGYSDQSIAATADYRNTTDGKRDTRYTSPFYIYGFAIPVDPNETLASITLPNDTNVKILSMVAVASPPVSAPFNLAATYSAAVAAPVLTWTAPTSGVIGYNVYRGTASGGESTTPINPTILPVGTASYTDNSTNSTTAPVAGNTYYYVVQAVNGPVGLISNQSAAVQIPGTSPVEVDLSGEYNLEGIVASGSTFSGGLDGGGHALDATALATAAAADLPAVMG